MRRHGAFGGTDGGEHRLEYSKTEADEDDAVHEHRQARTQVFEKTLVAVIGGGASGYSLTGTTGWTRLCPCWLQQGQPGR